MNARGALVAALAPLVVAGCGSGTNAPPSDDPGTRDVGYSIGNSMPGSWRPFSDSSTWNTPVPATATVHPLNETVLTTMTRTSTVRFAGSYMPPFWVVHNYDNTPKQHFHSDKIFDPWDCCPQDSKADIPLPIVPSMYAEPTSDGHIIILDQQYERLFECSRFDWPPQQEPTGSTFNIWDSRGDGHGTPHGWDRWQLQGGRGSGVPVIGGLVRPQELAAGEIRHALAFTFRNTRAGAGGKNMFIAPPAARSDGEDLGAQFPIEGMRFQLDPALTESVFDDWELDEATRVVARALQKYGAFLVDRGGDWAFQLQLLGPTSDANRAEWDARFPGMYEGMERIPTRAFRVIYTGEPTVL